MSSSMQPQNSTTGGNKKIVLLAMAIGFVIIAGLVSVLLTADDRPIANIGGEDGEIGGNFLLQGSQGEVALTDFEGQIVVLYFGFLSCPRVCPTSMGILKSTLERLEDTERAEVQPILISVDPARDTAAELDTFTNKFHPKILGLTGTVQQIDSVARDYGAYFKITNSESPDSDYAFEHTSRYYVINQQGELIDAMRHSTTANELVARIRTLL